MPSEFFFFNDTATTEIYTLSLHDALPISAACFEVPRSPSKSSTKLLSIFSTSSGSRRTKRSDVVPRSEEHTSELQSRQYLVCRLLLEKKRQLPRLCSRHDNAYCRRVRVDN